MQQSLIVYDFRLIDRLLHVCVCVWLCVRVFFAEFSWRYLVLVAQVGAFIVLTLVLLCLQRCSCCPMQLLLGLLSFACYNISILFITFAGERRAAGVVCAESLMNGGA